MKKVQFCSKLLKLANGRIDTSEILFLGETFSIQDNL